MPSPSTSDRCCCRCSWQSPCPGCRVKRQNPKMFPIKSKMFCVVAETTLSNRQSPVCEGPLRISERSPQEAQRNAESRIALRSIRATFASCVPVLCVRFGSLPRPKPDATKCAGCVALARWGPKSTPAGRRNEAIFAAETQISIAPRRSSGTLKLSA